MIWLKDHHAQANDLPVAELDVFYKILLSEDQGMVRDGFHKKLIISNVVALIS